MKEDKNHFVLFFIFGVDFMKVYNGRLFIEAGLSPILVISKFGIIKHYVFFKKDFNIYRKKILGDITIVGYTSFSKCNLNDEMQLNIDGINFSVYSVSKYKPFAYLSVGNNEYIAIENKLFFLKHFIISL